MKLGIEKLREDMNLPLNRIRNKMNKETREKGKEYYEKKGE